MSAPQAAPSAAGSAAGGEGGAGSGFGSAAPAIGNRIYVEPGAGGEGARLTAASVGTGLADHWQACIYKEMNSGARWGHRAGRDSLLRNRSFSFILSEFYPPLPNALIMPELENGVHRVCVGPPGHLWEW